MQSKRALVVPDSPLDRFEKKILTPTLRNIL